MNKRIEKFARECGAWNQVYGNRTFMIDDHFDIEKFAELIVRECANQLPRISEDYYTGDGIVEDAQKLILEHFGVEE